MNSKTPELHIGQKIKLLRAEKRLTQNDLSNCTSISKASISAYEQAERRPSEKALMQIAEAFDISYQDLISGTTYLQDTETAAETVEKRIQIQDAMEREKKKQQSRWANKAILQGYMLAVCKGHCELCSSKAPFLYDNGLPHLLLYILPEAEKSENEIGIKDCVMLCPNCFDKLFYKKSDEDYYRLNAIANKHELFK